MVEPIVVSVVPTKKTPQILAGLAGTVGCFACGMVFGWTAPALPNMEKTRAFNLTEGDKAWLGSLATLGVFLSFPLSGYMVHKFGRQRTMMLFSVPLFIGWMQLAFASSVLALKIGRFVTGFAGGSNLLTTPIYISEISDKNMRGFLGVCLSLQLSLGVLFAYVAGTFLNWSWLATVCSLAPLLLIVTMIFMPESPRYLLQVGKVSEASRSLCWLRGAGLTMYVDSELREIQENIEKSKASSGTWRDLLKTETWKPTFICVVLFVVQQCTGINIIIFYCVSLIQDTGTKLDSNLGSIILASSQVTAAVVSSALVDRFGRRILYIGSSVFMAIGMFLVGLYFILKENGLAESIGWVPILGLVIYIFSFGIGAGPIPPLLLGELLPPNTKGITLAITGMSCWLSSAIVIEIYGPVKDVVGDAWSYWIFGIFAIVGIAFVHFMLPETKGKTLEEIQETFQRKA